MQARLGKSAEKERHLRADNERLKSELDESMNRGDQLERKLEQTRRELQEAKRLRGVPRSSGGGQSSGRSSQIKHYPSLNGPTPVSTLSFANVVAHSTPINPNDVVCAASCSVVPCVPPLNATSLLFRNCSLRTPCTTERLLEGG